jgi:hypothetical protein
MPAFFMSKKLWCHPQFLKYNAWLSPRFNENTSIAVWFTSMIASRLIIDVVE